MTFDSRFCNNQADKKRRFAAVALGTSWCSLSVHLRDFRSHFSHVFPSSKGHTVTAHDAAVCLA